MTSMHEQYRRRGSLKQGGGCADPLTGTIEEPSSQISPSGIPGQCVICVGYCDLLARYYGPQRSDSDLGTFEKAECVRIAGMVDYGCERV